MKQEYFSALNEAEAEKYLGKTMEFANTYHVRNQEEWAKRKFKGCPPPPEYPFKDNTGIAWQFMRTCPETFKPEKRVFEKWINVYPCEKRYGCYNSREDADMSASFNRVTCLHIKQEYEVKGL